VPSLPLTDAVLRFANHAASALKLSSSNQVNAYPFSQAFIICLRIEVAVRLPSHCMKGGLSDSFQERRRRPPAPRAADTDPSAKMGRLKGYVKDSKVTRE
jgi:hypothetical protein